MNLQRPIICLVTDRARTTGPLVDVIRSAARAGVDLVQVRERDLADRALLSLTREAVAAVQGTAARVLVNGRADIALAGGAAGVHLRGDSIGACRLRSFCPSGFVIGRSVHSEEEAAAVEQGGGCDYVTFGAVFATSSKPAGHAAAGTAALGRVCRRVGLPVLAIGGISVTLAPDIASAGAAGVAAIGLFADTGDIHRTIGGLRSAFDT